MTTDEHARTAMTKLVQARDAFTAANDDSYEFRQLKNKLHFLISDLDIFLNVPPAHKHDNLAEWR